MICAPVQSEAHLEDRSVLRVSSTLVPLRVSLLVMSFFSRNDEYLRLRSVSVPVLHVVMNSRTTPVYLTDLTYHILQVHPTGSAGPYCKD